MLEQYMKRRTVDEEIHAPEALHKVTFGSVPRASMVTKLVEPSEVNSLMDGIGRFAGIRSAIEMTTTEFYAYLRLGVSSQGAMALKFLGYPTPESLVNSPITSGLLPDVLARRSGTYPTEFIDRCEAEGVSPVGAQLAIRRGITDNFLDMALTAHQLVYAFQVYVPKNAANLPSVASMESPVTFVCDGTVPLDALVGGTVHPNSIMGLGQEFRRQPDSDVVLRLRSDAALCRRFLNSLNERHKSKGVKGLLSALETYGEEIFSLRNPYLPVATFRRGPGADKREIGMETARYIEDVINAEQGVSNSHRDYYNYDGNLSLPYQNVGYAELDRLRRAGVPVHSVCELVFHGEVSVDVLIGARESGIASNLIDGAL